MTSGILSIGVGSLLIGHFVGLWLLLRNQRWMRWPPSSRPGPPADVSVSVIVPARNEAEDVEDCLRSLLAQDHTNLKIIVVNDHSEDDTPQITARIATGNPQLVVINNPPLQTGWLGKHNAMQAALQHVDTELVVMTDADVRFAPDCISTAVAEIQTRQLDLLSILPQFEFVTFCETMLLPIYVGGGALFLSQSIEDADSPHAMAAGAFILVRTARLRQINGYESIKTEILDDVAMARTFKKHGFAIGLRSAPDLMQVRFFKSNRHAFFGVTKHLLGIVQGHIWLAPLLAVAPLMMYGTLIIAAGYGIIQQRPVLAAAAFLTLGIHYAGLLATRPGNKFNALLALAFPCMSIQFAASSLRAVYLLLAKGKFQWRGRDTDLKAV